MKKYILASGSPRRRELLAMIDVDFRIDTTRSVDEVVPPGMPAEAVPMHLSKIKAEPYLADLQEDEVLITADTVVIHRGEIIGKPRDEEDACRILTRLQGDTHTVVTGVTISRKDHEPISFSELTTVEFSPLTDEEIKYYVTKYQPMDKAGAYGIQEWIGAAAVRSINGSFYNVMGLPINRLYHVLKNV